MKKTIHIGALCLITAFTFSTIIVSSASADLLFVPQKGTFPYLATSLLTNASRPIVTVGGSILECTTTHYDMQITDAHLGNVHILWLGCNEPGVGTCHSPGQASGRVLMFTVFHLGLGHRGTELKVPSVLILVPAGYEMTCGIIKITFTGAVIGELAPSAGLNKQSATISVFFKQTAGKQDMNLFLLSKLTNEEVMTGQVLKSTIFSEEESAEETDAEFKNPAGETIEIKEK